MRAPEESAELKEKLLCPSYTCVSGAHLIGVVQANGRVAFLGRPLEVDRTFVDIAKQGRPPELRFRFSAACAESACANWKLGVCRVAAQISQPAAVSTTELPNCGIRAGCRWYHEQGCDACAACPSIVRGFEG